MKEAVVADVIDELDREWRDLIATRGFVAELDVFVRRHRRLEALGASPRSPRWEPKEADEILHALLAECAGGSYPAGRTVLQCMVPAMRSIVRRSRRHYPDVADLQAETTAAMWSAIVTYDLSRTARVATRLQGATLTAVVGDGAPHARGRRVSRSGIVAEVAVPDAELERIVDREGAGFGSPAAVLGPTGEVLELVAWGVETATISAEDGALLARLYAPDPGLPEYAELDRGGRAAYQARVAAELGLPPATVRQRASRAIRRLARAVHDGDK
jgi:hypothetical protein